MGHIHHYAVSPCLGEEELVTMMMERNGIAHLLQGLGPLYVSVLYP